MASLLESKSVFQEKVRELGLPSAMIQSLEANGVTTLAMLAVCTSYTLESSDDQPLKTLCKDLKGGTDGSMAEIAVIRRLTIEAQTLIAADANLRFERTDDDKTKKWLT